MRRGNGDGGIFKLSGKRKNPYAVRITKGWTTDGKQIYEYIGYFKNKTESKKHLNNYLINPYELSNDKITAQFVFDEWEKTTKVSDDVIKAYRGVFKNSGLANKIFKDIKLKELELSAKDLSPAMQKRFRNAFKNLYIYAMKNDIVNKNLAELMELDKYKAGEKTVFKKDEIKKLWKNINTHPLADIPIILLYTGMRINELLELKSKTVNLEERCIVGGNKTINGKQRKIPIHKDIIPLIEKRLNDKQTYLISNKNGPVEYHNFVSNIWGKIVNDVIGKKHTPHETRHTFVTQAVKCKIDKVKIQKIVGHSAKDVTDHYTHFAFEDLLEAIDQFKY